MDPSARELRKHGVRIKLQDQPFAVLLILLEKPGQLVTKEELQQRLWPADTFVEFDKGIYNAIKRLRETLGDEAETPRYIETLPRRGYRFLVPVEWVTQDAHKPAPETTGTSPNSGRLTLVASVVCLLVAGAFVWVKLPSSPPMPRVVNSLPITKDGLPKADATLALVSDGTRLYFQEGLIELNTTLVQVSTQGAETAEIPVSLQNPVAFDFSQSHSELLLGAAESTFRYGERSLSVLPLPAGAPHRLGDIFAHDACWSPDGRRLVFENGNDVFGAKADGSEVRKLASPDGSKFVFGIRFSPDGRRLRFSVVDENEGGVMEMAADGSGLHRLPIDGGCCGSWSADGKYYFYIVDRDVWVLPEQRSLFGKIKLGTPAQLTAGPIAFSAPTPSVNGKELFVVGDQPRAELVRYARDSGQFVPFLGGSPQENWRYRPTASG